MKRALVFENSLSGHRGLYVAALAGELIRLGLQVTLALPDHVTESAEGNAFLPGVLQQAELLPLEKITVSNQSGMAFSKARLGLLQKAVNHHRFDRCYVPYADGLAQAWGAALQPSKFFPPDIRMEGLMMRGGFAYPESSLKNRLKAQISYRLQQRADWSVLHQLDPIAFYAMKGPNRKRTLLLPEFIEAEPPFDADQAREDFGLKKQSHVVVCPGAVNESKGADLLIQAVRRLPPSSNVHLLLIGKHSDKVRQILAANSDRSRITSIDRFATAAEFSKLFAVADTVAVCYPRHVGSSSILLRAAKAQKQILASDWGWVGWATMTFQLGETCDAQSVDSISNSLIKLTTNPNANNINSTARDQILAYHSPSNHLAHWTSGICDQLGLPASGKIDFESVLAAVKTDRPNLKKP
jgi:glycosyltransferase involved in cell wall biosynthesis